MGFGVGPVCWGCLVGPSSCVLENSIRWMELGNCLDSVIFGFVFWSGIEEGFPRHVPGFCPRQYDWGHWVAPPCEEFGKLVTPEFKIRIPTAVPA